MKYKILILGLILLGGRMNASWVSLFQKKIAPHEAIVAQRLNQYLFSKEQVSPFTQLLFSWNALRPSIGHFEFYVQARNARTKKWGSWHRMIEWGNRVQRSHLTESDGFTKYEHVRLETERLQLADAFRIKVVGMGGAPLSLLKGVAVTSVNMRKFRPENAQGVLAQLPSIHIPVYPSSRPIVASFLSIIKSP